MGVHWCEKQCAFSQVEFQKHSFTKIEEEVTELLSTCI